MAVAVAVAAAAVAATTTTRRTLCFDHGRYHGKTDEQGLAGQFSKQGNGSTMRQVIQRVYHGPVRGHDFVLKLDFLHGSKANFVHGLFHDVLEHASN